MYAKIIKASFFVAIFLTTNLFANEYRAKILKIRVFHKNGNYAIGAPDFKLSGFKRGIGAPIEPLQLKPNTKQITQKFLASVNNAKKLNPASINELAYQDGIVPENVLRTLSRVLQETQKDRVAVRSFGSQLNTTKNNTIKNGSQQLEILRNLAEKKKSAEIGKNKKVVDEISISQAARERYKRILIQKNKNAKEFRQKPIQELSVGDSSIFVHSQVKLEAELKTLTSIKASGQEEFDLVFNDNPYQVLHSQHQKIYLTEKIRGAKASRAATIEANHCLPLNMDVLFENGTASVNFPLIGQRDYEHFLEKNNLIGDGGNVLIRFDNQIADVIISSNYEDVFYLDGNLKKIDNKIDADYVFYIGVAPGNTNIIYSTFEGVDNNKTIYVEHGSIYFAEIALEKTIEDKFNLKSERIFAKKYEPINISEDHITLLDTNKHPRKLNINTFEFINLSQDKNTRQYMEIKDAKNSVVVGRWSQQGDIIIPNYNYHQSILETFNLRDLSNKCLIQFNIDAPLKAVHVQATGPRGPLVFDEYVLDQNGNFLTEISGSIKKFFFLGELHSGENGIVRVSLKYGNGSSQFISSYCSDGLYLVEQL